MMRRRMMITVWSSAHCRQHSVQTHIDMFYLLAFDKASYRCRPIAALVASVRWAVPSLAASDCGEAPSLVGPITGCICGCGAAPLLVASGGGASATSMVKSGCREAQSIIASACRSAHLVVERPHHWLHRT